MGLESERLGLVRRGGSRTAPDLSALSRFAAFRGAYPHCIGEGRTQFQLCVGTR